MDLGRMNVGCCEAFGMGAAGSVGVSYCAGWLFSKGKRVERRTRNREKGIEHAVVCMVLLALAKQHQDDTHLEQQRRDRSQLLTRNQHLVPPASGPSSRPITNNMKTKKRDHNNQTKASDDNHNRYPHRLFLFPTD
mmetsp:Transcript_15256/g.22397  ORF Transcript_15256/g.22397 Transcript_15256/m.22397 type:complete len:136 (-) Transcript_15256:42-449(-)